MTLAIEVGELGNARLATLWCWFVFMILRVRDSSACGMYARSLGSVEDQAILCALEQRLTLQIKRC